MKNHTRKVGRDQVQVHSTTKETSYTHYAGVLTLVEVWQRLGVSEMLSKADIHYGTQEDQAEAMSFVLTMAPFVGARSNTKAAQRFGGEPSKEGLEKDELLSCIVSHPPSQRQVSRFLNVERYDWDQYNLQRLRRLQRVPACVPHRKGVIIVDDMPLAKPHAEEMPYLTPIWDSALKRKVPGYSVVHLYYDAPHRPRYSVYVEPWLKTSVDGTTEPKRRGQYRPALEGEERSKLDIALDALTRYLPLIDKYEAVIFDSWYTARWFCHALTEMGVRWVGEAGADKKFQVGVHYLSVPEIYQAYRTRTRPVKGFKRRVRAVLIPAVIRPDRFTKVAQLLRLVLVIGLTRPRENDKGYKLLVCNQLHWTLRRILRVYSCRPHIEAAHRAGKQHAGWNDFHTRSLAALSCHLMLCLLRCDLLMLSRIWFPVWAKYSLAQTIDHLIGHVAPLTIAEPTQVCIHVTGKPPPALAFRTDHVG